MTLADLVRAMGPRSGPAAETPTDWNVGFILVTPSGVTPSAGGHRQGRRLPDALRAVVHHRHRRPGLDPHRAGAQGNCTLPPPVTDGGTPDCRAAPGGRCGDASMPGPPPVVDAGTPDAGPVVDAGTSDAGGGQGCGIIPCDDGGSADAGTPDAGKPLATLATSGCGCSAAASAGAVLPALGLLLLAGLRRRRS